jgi:hypothetical protein
MPKSPIFSTSRPLVCDMKMLEVLRSLHEQLLYIRFIVQNANGGGGRDGDLWSTFRSWMCFKPVGRKCSAHRSVRIKYLVRQ